MGGNSSKYPTCQCRRRSGRRFDPWVRRPPGGEMATHSSFPACRIPWTEEPGGLQSMGSQRVKTWLSTHEHNNIQANGSHEKPLFPLLYINFSIVDIHYLGYTHTFLKGLPSFTFPINNSLNTWGSAAKIPCSSFMKSSKLSLPDFTLDIGADENSSPQEWLRGKQNPFLSDRM